MATATLQGVEVIKQSLLPEQTTFIAGAAYTLAPMKIYNPPKPIDAKGSRSNAELREIAKKQVPPESWFDSEEEQVF